MSIILTIYVTLAHFIKKLMSIILTIYVTFVHFIKKTNVNHPTYICNIRSNVNHPNYICNISPNVNYPNYICNIRPFYKKLMSFILTIYVTFAHFIKMHVNHPN